MEKFTTVGKLLILVTLEAYRGFKEGLVKQFYPEPLALKNRQLLSQLKIYYMYIPKLSGHRQTNNVQLKNTSISET